MSTDKYPTASAVLPMMHVMSSALTENPDEREPAAIKEMKSNIIADMKKRYPEESCGFKMLNKASYLDPRFHLLVHLTAEQRQEVG